MTTSRTHLGPAQEEMGQRTRAGVAFLVLTGVYAASVLLPLPGMDGRIAHLPSVCPFYTVTGLPCPGCGLTRAFVCIAHGRVIESLHWHALGGALFLLGIVLWVCAGLTWVRNEPAIRLTPTVSSGLSWSLLAVIVLFGAARIALIVTRCWTF